MKIEIKAGSFLASILKGKSTNVDCSLSVLRRSGMNSLADRLEANRALPLEDYMMPVVVELGTRSNEWSETAHKVIGDNLPASALYELGLSAKSALRNAGEIEIEIL